MLIQKAKILGRTPRGRITEGNYLIWSRKDFLLSFDDKYWTRLEFKCFSLKNISEMDVAALDVEKIPATF
jgi:hypothetical protein